MDLKRVSKVQTTQYVYEQFTVQGVFSKKTETKRRESDETTTVYRDGKPYKRERITWYGNQGCFKKRVLSEFNEEGLEVKVTEYDQDDRVSDVTRKEYDSHGNLTLFRAKSRITDFEQRYHSEYDSNGNRILEVNDTDKTFSKYKYDRDNNLVEAQYYDASLRMTGGRMFHYDIEGRLASIYEDGKPFKLLHYNFEGLTDNMVLYDSKGCKTEYEYEYVFDYNHNWIKQTIYKAGVLDSVIERRILYI